MSGKIQQIIDACNNQLQNIVPKLATEKSRVLARRMLLNLEKECKQARKELMEESHRVKKERQQRKIAKAQPKEEATD